MSFDLNIDIDIQIGNPAVTGTNFGVPLVAGDSMLAGFTERIRFYSSAQEAAQDADLSLVLQGKVSDAFQQNLNTNTVAIGRLDARTADVWNVAITAPGAGGDTARLTILCLGS